MKRVTSVAKLTGERHWRRRRKGHTTVNKRKDDDCVSGKLSQCMIVVCEMVSERQREQSVRQMIESQ